MKHTLSRILSVALVLAMLVTCAIPGLVLPVAAEEEPAAITNLFPYGDFEDLPAQSWYKTVDTVKEYVDFTGKQGYTGTGFEIAADDFNQYNLDGSFFTAAGTSLEQGKEYILTLKAKGGAIYFRLTADIWREISTTASDGWVECTTHIKAGTNCSSFSAFLYRKEGETAATYIDDISLTPYNDNEDMISAAASACDVKSNFWSKLTDGSNGSITTDPDDETNSVIAIEPGKNNLWLSPSVSALNRGRLISLEFDLKGDGMSYYTSGNATFKGAIGTLTASSTWKHFALFNAAGGSSDPSSAYTFMLRTDSNNGGGKVYLDNIQVRYVTEATSFTLADTTVEAGTSKALDFNVVPKNAFPGTLTWESDSTAVTVSGGTVTGKQGTATNTDANITVSSSLAGIEPGTAHVDLTYPIEAFTNGDVEAGKTGIFKNSNIIAEGVGFNGSNCIEIPAETSKTTYPYMGNVFLKPNTLYRYSFLAKYEASSGSTYVNPGIYGAQNVKSIYLETVTGDKWAEHSLYIRTGDEPHFTDATYNSAICCNSTTHTSAIYLDNFSLKQVAEDEPWFSYDFEDGAIPNFFRKGTFLAGSVADGEGVDGSKAFALQTTSTADTTAGWGFLLEPGSTYMLSFKTKGGPTGSYVAYVPGSHGDLINTTSGLKGSSAGELGGNADWKTYTYYWKAGEDTSTAWPTLQGWAFYLHTVADKDPVYIDDLIFTKVSPITTLDLSETELVMANGDVKTVTLGADLTKSYAGTVTATSDNTAVATVAYANGTVTVTAKKMGTATITVKAEMGKSPDLTTVEETITVDVNDQIINGTFESDEKVILNTTTYTEGVTEEWKKYKSDAWKNGSSYAAFVRNTPGVDEPADATDSTNRALYIATNGTRYLQQGTLLRALSPEKTYIFSYDCKGEHQLPGGSVNGTKYIYFDTRRECTLKRDNGWWHYEVEFTIATDNGYEYIVGGTGVGQDNYAFSFNPTESIYVDNISIKAKEDAPIELSVHSRHIAPGVTGVLGTKNAWNGTGCGRISWSSSNPEVATVDPNRGLITAVAPGTATITASAGNGTTDTCLINVSEYGNMLFDGDFENSCTSVWKWATTEEVDGNRAIKLTNYGSDLFFQDNLCKNLEPNTDYTVSFRVMTPCDFPVNGRLYFNQALNSATTYFTAPADHTWKNYTKTITTGAEITTNKTWEFTLLGDTANNIRYIDDIIIQKVGGFTAESSTEGAITLSAGDTPAAVISATEPETQVTVNVTPATGKLMVPGSLKYTTSKGQTVKILNKAGEFGEGNGNTFAFAAPEAGVSINVTADFVDATQQDFVSGTIGTSVYRTDEQATPTGVRFLTRTNFLNLDLSGNAITVKYNGQNHTIKEIGSLLKRSGNAKALTIDNFDATDFNGETRLWKAASYTAGSSTMTVTDYTTGSLDYTVVMKTKTTTQAFVTTVYETRGYIILDDDTVIYTDAMSDSASAAVQRGA